MLPARLSASERRIALVQILAERPDGSPWLTTAHLCQHFDCDRRTLEHDLEALRNAGRIRTQRQDDRRLRLWAKQ